jgi:hypothetical protein
MTKRRRSGASKKLVEARFWGQTPLGAGSLPDGSSANTEGSRVGASPGEAAATPAGIRPTTDPGALVRSLGPPPLAGDPALSQRTLTTVYEEAVKTATAIAAANGLLARDDRATADS